MNQNWACSWSSTFRSQSICQHSSVQVQVPHAYRTGNVILAAVHHMNTDLTTLQRLENICHPSIIHIHFQIKVLKANLLKWAWLHITWPCNKINDKLHINMMNCELYKCPKYDPLIMKDWLALLFHILPPGNAKSRHTDRGQIWFRKWRFAWRHQPITFTNIETPRPD